MHSDKRGFCALSLTSVVNAFAKETAPSTLVVLSNLTRYVPLLIHFKPHYFAVRALACTGRHSRARGLLNMFVVQLCERDADGTPQNKLAKLQ